MKTKLKYPIKAVVTWREVALVGENPTLPEIVNPEVNLLSSIMLGLTRTGEEISQELDGKTVD